MIIDFGVIKRVVGNWIDDHWDHTGLLYEEDKDAGAAAIAEANARFGKPVYFMAKPPTAENLAEELARVATKLLEPHSIEVVMIRLWETPNCLATWEKGRAIDWTLGKE